MSGTSTVNQGDAGTQSWAVGSKSHALSGADTAAPAANAAATLAYAAAAPGVANVLGGIYWSFDADPGTDTVLSVSDGATVIFQVYVTSKGPGYLPFNSPIKGSVATAMTVSLAAGGAGIKGSLNANHWTE